MARPDPTVQEIVDTLRESRLWWLGDIVADAVAELPDEAADSPQGHISAALQQLKVAGEAAAAVAEGELTALNRIPALAERLGIASVKVLSDEGELTPLDTPVRRAALEAFAVQVRSAVEAAAVTVRQREGLG